ncbi:hypothetical protein NKI40_35405 [Mesorhizobium sp. M0643]
MQSRALRPGWILEERLNGVVRDARRAAEFLDLLARFADAEFDEKIGKVDEGRVRKRSLQGIEPLERKAIGVSVDTDPRRLNAPG